MTTYNPNDSSQNLRVEKSQTLNSLANREGLDRRCSIDEYPLRIKLSLPFWFADMWFEYINLNYPHIVSWR